MNIKLSARGLAAALFAMLLIGGFCGRASADTPVSACGTLSPAGNYFLTKNLSATGDCLVIGAKNVAIDLKGNTITGNGTGSGITDGGFARNFAIIANGKIRNFQRGVNLTGSEGVILSNLDSSKNTDEGIFISGCCNTLNSVTANNNSDAGIDIDSDDSSLTKIQANGNGGGGILITECCNLLDASTANKNTGIGVQINVDDSFVVSSKMQHNSGDGLEMDFDNGVIKTNTSNNGGDGMDFASTVNLVAESKSSGNAGAGIDFGGRWGIISGVHANKNAGGGVTMLCRGSTASLTAQHNSGSNLIQTVSSDGPCANVNLKAP